MFWLFWLLVAAVRLRTALSVHEPRHHLVAFVLGCVRFGLAIFVFALECICPEEDEDTFAYKRLPADASEADVEEEARKFVDFRQRPPPIVRANIFSQCGCFFSSFWTGNSC